MSGASAPRIRAICGKFVRFLLFRPSADRKQPGTGEIGAMVVRARQSLRAACEEIDVQSSQSCLALSPGQAEG